MEGKYADLAFLLLPHDPYSQISLHIYLPHLPIPTLSQTAIMSWNNKIARTANAPRTAPSEIEQQIAQALLDLETNVPELKAELRQLQISAAKEVDVKGGKKAVVVFVPVPMAKAFHKVQQRCVSFGGLGERGSGG